mgnify:FL=1
MWLYAFHLVWFGLDIFKDLWGGVFQLELELADSRKSVEEMNVGLGLGAVAATGNAGSWVWVLVFLIAIGGFVVFVGMKKKGKRIK